VCVPVLCLCVNTVCVSLCGQTPPLPRAVVPSIHLREGGAAFPFCRVCVPRPRGGRWRSWDVNLGPQDGGEPRTHLLWRFWGPCSGAGGLPTWGSMRACFLCSLLLRPPSRGEASPPLPVLVTHPLACASGWLGTSLLEATCLGLHGGAWWDCHPMSWE
uniref:Uncharacterized protein n=1 Tax=Aotus nancymaae TaxID=37293 RepID=A0A2K5E4E8_AOTNA